MSLASFHYRHVRYRQQNVVRTAKIIIMGGLPVEAGFLEARSTVLT